MCGGPIQCSWIIGVWKRNSVMPADVFIVLPDEFNAATYFIDRHIADGRGQKIAIECGERNVTYQHLFEMVNRVGNCLRKLGVRIEERVGLLLFDTPEFAATFFGAIKIGAVPVPFNTLLKPADYNYLLNDSRARVAIVSEALRTDDQSNSTTRVEVSGNHSRCGDRVVARRPQFLRRA